MTPFTILSHKSYRRLPWKNGLGATLEIAIHPPDADFNSGDFDFRISSATIDCDSEFSRFPDHDRILIITKGAGLRLLGPAIGDRSYDLLPGCPFEFSGANEVRCKLLAGAVADLNVFSRRTTIGSVTDVRAIECGAKFIWTPSRRWAFAVAIDGNFTIEAASAQASLNMADTVRIGESSEPRQIVFSTNAPTAKLALIEFSCAP